MFSIKIVRTESAEEKQIRQLRQAIRELERQALRAKIADVRCRIANMLAPKDA